MTAFASADDFATRLGLTLTDAEKTRATALLNLAAGLVRDCVKQTISLVDDDELTLLGTNAGQVTLPERPVVSVASVTLDGADVRFTLDGDTLLGRDGWSGGFGCRSQTLVVTYTHGYAADAIPSIAKQISMEAVQRVWSNPGAVIAERIGDEDVTYAPYSDPPQGLLLTDAEERKLKRFFGMRSANVMVG